MNEEETDEVHGFEKKAGPVDCQGVPTPPKLACGYYRFRRNLWRQVDRFFKIVSARESTISSFLESEFYLENIESKMHFPFYI